jgi:hypothetical protein
LAAIVALVAAAAAVVLVIVFLARNGTWVILGLAGVVSAVAGAWRVAVRRGAHRVIGIALVVVGLGLLAGAVVGVGGGPAHEVLRLAAVVVLLAIAVTASRAALHAELRSAATPVVRRAAPRHPVLICNPWSGGGKVERFGLVELARSLGVETILLDRDHDLRTLAEEAVASGADCLGMAGGDGSQALVATVVPGTTSPSIWALTATIRGPRCAPSSTPWSARSTTPRSTGASS